MFWTQPAQEDLGRIDDVLFLFDPAYAYRVGLAAIESAKFLTKWPGAGELLDSGKHKWRVENTPYLLFYRLAEGRIEILRVRHDRENWRDEE